MSEFATIAENELVQVNANGQKMVLSCNAAPLRDASGTITGSIVAWADITERKRLERALQNRLREQQTILDSVPALAFYKNKENRFIQVNKTFVDTMGVSRNELEGKSLFDLYTAEQAEAYWRDDKEVLASGKAKRGIVEAMETDTGTRLVQTDKVPYVDETGEVAGIIGFSLDITERRIAEEALRSSEERLRLAMEIGGIGSFDGDMQANTVFWDAQAQKILGITEKTTPAEIMNIIHPDDRARLSLEGKKPMDPRTRDLNPQEFRTVLSDGQVRWVSTLGRVYYDESADPPVPMRRIGVIHFRSRRRGTCRR